MDNKCLFFKHLYSDRDERRRATVDQLILEAYPQVHGKHDLRQIDLVALWKAVESHPCSHGLFRMLRNSALNFPPVIHPSKEAAIEYTKAKSASEKFANFASVTIRVMYLDERNQPQTYISGEGDWFAESNDLP